MLMTGGWCKWPCLTLTVRWLWCPSFANRSNSTMSVATSKAAVWPGAGLLQDILDPQVLPGKMGKSRKHSPNMEGKCYYVVLIMRNQGKRHSRIGFTTVLTIWWFIMGVGDGISWNTILTSKHQWEHKTENSWFGCIWLWDHSQTGHFDKENED